ncbi:hypothetical protein ILUMI_06360 [Ignelater luminosus]|uniref:Alpha-1,6-mannosyl-glycoprotein 2-beta-N-acetylglucosaminyltransferase n=1 Tax=Ignelater luminosus TaxID=2038154 RepID=A0A8K0D8L5_IGNLU|nr:hypothetical protein ILUMI_06360 [Ignelater luminosus]
MRHTTAADVRLKRIPRYVFCFLTIFPVLLMLFSLPFLDELAEFNFQRNVSKSMSLYNLTEKKYDDSNRRRLIEQISLFNKEQKVKNEEIFGTLNNYSLVIVIQVNIRLHYLRYLIRSLGQAQDIDKALLVFSHDFFDENINHLVNSIKFCKFIQIFYPHSIQLYPNVFPGQGLKDCPRNSTKDEAIQMGCLNAFNSDRNGNYRNPQLCQAKHHWWWKANRVFDLASLQSYKGLVLFLEEDNYVLKDFIHVLKLMEEITKYSCRHCKLLAMASNSNTEAYYKAAMQTSKVAITDRFSNYGMVFNRSVWKEIIKCKYSFCFYDDYNFDFSFRNVFLSCMKESHFLVLYAARVFHLGAW